MDVSSLSNQEYEPIALADKKRSFDGLVDYDFFGGKSLRRAKD